VCKEVEVSVKCIECCLWICVYFLNSVLARINKKSLFRGGVQPSQLPELFFLFDWGVQARERNAGIIRIERVRVRR